MTRGEQVSEYNKVRYDIGGRYTELNAILRRIRRRRSGEPTEAERERLAVLRSEIAELRRAGGDA